MDNDISALLFSDIASRCREESARYFQKQQADNRYCIELFRLALIEKNQQAWSTLYQQYTPLVLKWLQKGYHLAHINEPIDALVNETFAKFWSAITPDKFATFSDLSALLSYLQMCAGSVILDCLRSRRRKNESELDSQFPDPQNNYEQIHTQELLGRIEQRLKNSDERLIFFAMFTLAMKPSEICAEWPERFSTVRRVNQIRQNIVDRLGRDEALKRYYTM